jgi:hypothetical protein
VISRRRALLTVAILVWGGLIAVAYLNANVAVHWGHWGRRLAWLAADGARLSLILLSSLGLGLPLVRRLLPDTSVGIGERLLFSAGSGLLFLSLLMLVLGLVGGYRSGWAWLLLSLGAIWGGWQLQGYQQLLREGIERITKMTFAPVDWALLGCAGAGMLYSLMSYAIAPPLSWDELAYHLAIPKLYVTQQQLINVPYIMYSNSPFNMEMLYTLGLLLHSDILPHLMMFSLSMLLSIALVLFSAKRFDYRVGLFALAIYWSMEAVQVLSGVALVEIGLAYYTWLALYAFIVWVEQCTKGWLWVSGLMGGAAAGSKLTGAVIPLLLLTGVLLISCLHRRKRSAHVVQHFLWFGLPVILTVLPWYLKSYAMTGNPVWPFLNTFFGGQYWDKIGEAQHLAYLRSTNLTFSLQNLVTTPWHIAVQPRRFGSYPLSLLPLWLVPFAPLLMRVRQREKITISIMCLFGLAYYLIWFMLTHQTRFLLPVVPVMCLLSGYVAWRLRDRLGRWTTLLLLGILVAMLPWWSAQRTALWEERLTYLRGAVSRRALLHAHIDVMPAFDYCNTKTPHDAVILLFPYENRGYYLDRAYVWANLLSQRYIKFEEFKDAEALWRELRRLGITHILDRPAFTQYTFAPGVEVYAWRHARHLIDELERQYAHLEFQDKGVYIYRLQSP